MNAITTTDDTTNNTEEYNIPKDAEKSIMVEIIEYLEANNIKTIDDVPDYRKGFEQAISVMATSSGGKDYTNYNFYMHMLAACEIKFDILFPAPAGVYFNINKYVLKINPLPMMFGGMTLEQRLAVLKHEMLHICYNHPFRFKSETYIHELANVATDCAINQQIEASHFGDMVSKICLPKNLEIAIKNQFNKDIPVPENLTSEQYYEFLKKIIEENQDQNQCQCGCSCDSDNSDKQNQQGEGESNQDDQQDGNSGNRNQNGQGNQDGNCPKCGKPKKQNALGGLKQMDDHSIWKESKGSEQLAKEIAGDIVNRAVQKSRGNLPSNIESILELLFEKPQINWREVTKRIVGNKKLNTKKVLYKTNRRMPHRQELKGTIKDRTFELVVVVDESGSMSNDEINYGLNEIRAICKMQNSTVKVLHIDTEVKEISSFGKTDTVYKRSSCGGTYMYPAIEYMVENKVKHDAIIFITDGEIEDVDDWEFQPNKPIIFLTTNRMIESNNPRYRCFKLDYKTGV